MPGPTVVYDGPGIFTNMIMPDIRDHFCYDEFGKPAPGNSKQSEDGRINLHNTFGYTGEQWDEEANLLYLRARYYEPETGRFLSRDTYEGELENPLSKNLYAYVGNNPINLVDHSGKWAEKAHEALTRDIIDSFVKSYGGTNLGKFLKKYKQKIIDHSNDPDGYYRNIVGGFQWADHFYNPETGKNYKKNDKLGTAPGRVKEYMSNAEEGYDSINDDSLIAAEFAKAIAWALHYLEDMSNPYHTSDKIGGPNSNSDHSDYEDWAEKRVNNKTVKVITKTRTYEIIAKELAQKSHDDAKNKWIRDSKYKDERYKLPQNNNDLNYYFDLARQYGTQLLYSFYNTVE